MNSTLNSAKPVYEVMKGWNTDITAIRHYDDLSVEARNYIEKIELYTGVKVKHISVGPKRDALNIKD